MEFKYGLPPTLFARWIDICHLKAPLLKISVTGFVDSYFDSLAILPFYDSMSWLRH